MLSTRPRLIGVRHVPAGSARVPVLLFKNEGGSVAGRLLIGEGDEPILDSATVQDVLKLSFAVLPSAFQARASGWNLGFGERMSVPPRFACTRPRAKSATRETGP